MTKDKTTSGTPTKVEVDEYEDADVKIGAWLSAALEDDNVCAEMKVDITRWFTARESMAQVLQSQRTDLDKAKEILKDLGKVSVPVELYRLAPVVKRAENFIRKMEKSDV